MHRLPKAPCRSFSNNETWGGWLKVHLAENNYVMGDSHSSLSSSCSILISDLMNTRSALDLYIAVAFFLLAGESRDTDSYATPRYLMQSAPPKDICLARTPSANISCPRACKGLSKHHSVLVCLKHAACKAKAIQFRKGPLLSKYTWEGQYLESS